MKKVNFYNNFSSKATILIDSALFDYFRFYCNALRCFTLQQLPLGVNLHPITFSTTFKFFLLFAKMYGHTKDVISSVVSRHDKEHPCYVLYQLVNYFQSNGVGIFNHPHQVASTAVKKSSKGPGTNRFFCTLKNIVGNSQAHKSKEYQFFPHVKIRNRNAHIKLLKSNCVCSASVMQFSQW